MAIPVTVNDKRRVRLGLEDGKHILLACSNCQHKLVEIWVTQPDAKRPDGTPYEWKALATCWKCGDRSYPITFQGNFHPGPAAELRQPTFPGEEVRRENDRLISALADARITDNEVIFITCKPPE